MDLSSSADDALIEVWEDGDTAETNIDGISEYGYGFWFKYLSLHPDRVL
jgi:hypothetical protein